MFRSIDSNGIVAGCLERRVSPCGAES